ncbi:glycerophosphodiester phosphodiesterase [Candidatus Solirubrobacter pratensis]|uniref:glycerophosphodiester phosphodiesterase n=1 Tax=Candidatus Solirubrobacter pratensis TaxID=1298857 RepID=UPI000487AA73|nr:glycerophosphodiester phosphodiesterase [Candidatus Solirubrobacter pratensis]
MPELPALRRVGHKGADLIVPGNTPASFDAALRAGVDMIEFDVLPERHEGPDHGRLLLAHDYSIDLGGAPTLEDGLAHLASAPFDGVELDVDLKLPGYEQRVVAALQEHGLVERTLISSNWMRSLVAIRALEPRLRLGWSVPRVKRDWTASTLTRLPAYVGIQVVRRRLPGLVRRHMAAGRCDALMAHWLMVTPPLVDAVRDAGGELYVWTVDELPRIGSLRTLGVTGVITNDPRLFAYLNP